MAGNRHGANISAPFKLYAANGGGIAPFEPIDRGGEFNGGKSRRGLNQRAGAAVHFVDNSGGLFLDVKKQEQGNYHTIERVTV